MRRRMVVGNWKMNTLLEEGLALFGEIVDGLDGDSLDVTIGIACPFTHVYALGKRQSEIEAHIWIGAQDCSQHPSGAYTGEVSAKMIHSVGGQFVIIGHSERRKYHAESGKILQNKFERAIENKLSVIYCIGESLEQRESGKLWDVLEEQLREGLSHLSKEDWSRVTLAYEPVWAIGTGKTASPEQAQEVHTYLRKKIRDQWDAEIADSLTILYGGSCKPSNAGELFAQPDIDGGLIGGASLKATDFNAIIRSFPS